MWVATPTGGGGTTFPGGAARGHRLQPGWTTEGAFARTQQRSGRPGAARGSGAGDCRRVPAAGSDADYQLRPAARGGHSEMFGRANGGPGRAEPPTAHLGDG